MDFSFLDNREKYLTVIRGKNQKVKTNTKNDIPSPVLKCVRMNITEATSIALKGSTKT